MGHCRNRSLHIDGGVCGVRGDPNVAELAALLAALLEQPRTQRLALCTDSKFTLSSLRYLLPPSDTVDTVDGDDDVPPRVWTDERFGPTLRAIAWVLYLREARLTLHKVSGGGCEQLCQPARRAHAWARRGFDAWLDTPGPAGRSRRILRAIVTPHRTPWQVRTRQASPSRSCAITACCALRRTPWLGDVCTHAEECVRWWPTLLDALAVAGAAASTTGGDVPSPLRRWELPTEEWSWWSCPGGISWSQWTHFLLS
eukprot:COSAG01_NODE_1899_length_8965_cov_3.885969_3_plen_256_part_00